MSATLTKPPLDGPADNGLTRGRLTTPIHLAVVAVALAVGAATWVADGAVNWGRWALVSAPAYMIGIYVAARILENRRQATDRLARTVMTGAFVVISLPLVSVIYTVVENGVARLDGDFLTGSMRNVVGEGGGAYHAIIGTLIVTGLAALISVPIGVLTAVYLVEYGRGKLARAITMMVDLMTGIPSIVAGLFAYALFVRVWGPGTRTAIAGAVALSVLMVPIVVRASEEMLRLVPDELREASYALGVPKWKTVVKVVLRTSVAGLVTGVTLAIARVIGETAPLLVAAGITDNPNKNPVEGRMMTLPVYAYSQYQNPGVPPEAGQERAWAAALCLIIIVAVLFSLARVLSSALKPKGLR